MPVKWETIKDVPKKYLEKFIKKNRYTELKKKLKILQDESDNKYTDRISSKGY